MNRHVSQLAAVVTFTILSLNLVHAAKSETLQEEAAIPANSSALIDGVDWIFPTSASSSAFNSVDTLNAQWQSTYAKPSLDLWCKSQDGPKFTSRSNFNVAQTGSKPVLLAINQIKQTVICHFTLQDTTNLTSTSNSAPFTITKSPNATPQTWSANSPTIPTTSIATSELAASTSTSSPSMNSPAAPSNNPSVASVSSTHTLTTAAGVAIGIGVAVLVTLLALGALLLYLHKRQRRQHAQTRNGVILSNANSSMILKKKTIRVIPGIYETVGNRPIPQELAATASVVTLTRSPHESVRSDSGAHQNSLGDQRSQRGSAESSPRGSTRGRIGEADGLGGYI